MSSSKVITDNIPVGIAAVRLDADGYHTLDMNSELSGRLRIDGDSLARLFDDDSFPFIHPDDAGRFSLMLYKGGVAGGRFSETIRILRPDETYGWVSVSLNSVVDSDGSFLLYFVFTDVDDQRESELKLEKTYEELIGVMNNAPGGIIVFDTKNDRDPYPSYVSPGMCRLMNAPESMAPYLFSSGFYAAVHPEDREHTVRTIEDSIRNLSPFHIALRLMSIDGEYLWVDASGSAEQSKGRRTIYVSFADSSVSRKAQELLRHIMDIFVRRQYELISIIDCDSGTYRILSSKKIYDGFLPEEGLGYGEAVAALIDGNVIESERESLTASLKTDAMLGALSKSDDIELYATVRLPGGALRYKKVWICRIDDAGHELAAVLSDYTELHEKQIEQQETLVSALRAAEQANVAKSVFLSRMSHDIRTPLNAIIGYTHMLLASCDDPESRDKLAKIDTASDYLLSLINDVLDMSRIESGKYSLKDEPFDMFTLLFEVRSIIAPQCENSGLTYSSERCAGIRRTYTGDRVKLQQVLVNILGNSVKFSDPGGTVSLVVSETASYEGYAMVRFVLSDTGIGMSDEFLPRIFDAFTREDPADMRRTGTGLGLAICKNIISLMNGTISVESEKNKGTVFTIDIRLGLAETEAEPDVVTGASREPVDFGGKRVLLAEDNLMNQEIARYILESAGFTVSAVENGREALDMFAAEAPGSFSVLIFDINMPVMDGIEAARAIRDLPRDDAAKIPIVALSADAFDEDISRSLASGINAHLIKPIDKNQLFSTLERLL